MIELPLSFDLDEGPEILFDFLHEDLKYDAEQFVNALQDSLPIKVVAGTRCIAKATNFEIEGSKLMFWVKGPEEELQKLKASNCELAPAWIRGNKDKPFRKIVELNPGPLQVGWNEEVQILGPEKKRKFDPLCRKMIQMKWKIKENGREKDNTECGYRIKTLLNGAYCLASDKRFKQCDYDNCVLKVVDNNGDG